MSACGALREWGVACGALREWALLSRPRPVGALGPHGTGVAPSSCTGRTPWGVARERAHIRAPPSSPLTGPGHLWAPSEPGPLSSVSAWPEGWGRCRCLSFLLNFHFPRTSVVPAQAAEQRPFLCLRVFLGLTWCWPTPCSESSGLHSTTRSGEGAAAQASSSPSHQTWVPSPQAQPRSRGGAAGGTVSLRRAGPCTLRERWAVCFEGKESRCQD